MFFFSAETAELDLDGQGGKMFLRVLLNLVMHNYPAVVSGALQLLFRHFSQRQEVLQAFKQVNNLYQHFHIIYLSNINLSMKTLFNIMPSVVGERFNDS